MVGNLTVVIPFYNGHQYINKLIQSIPKDIPVIVVDDLSSQSLTNLWSTLNVKVIRLDQKGYFAGAVNAGIQACKTDVLVLNQDSWFEDDRAFGLIDDLRNEGFAMIGERIRGIHPTFGAFGYIHGTFMYLRRDALSAVGLLNDELYPLWGNTAELQLRMSRKNYPVLPLEKIPGFRHERPTSERYGSSIRQLLDSTPTSEKKKLVSTPPLLSVIVPCYNYGRYLEDCINSLIGGPTVMGMVPGQSLQSFEVIIVNDASTDNSKEYINRLISYPKGIRAYHLQKNVGTAKALNYGIERAVGQYITFLSADDMREPWSLESLVKACQANPHSFAYDDIWLCYKHQRIKKWEMGEYDFETLLYKNQIHAGIVYPKIAWEEVGGYPAIMDDGREDWAFNVALGVHGWCGVHVKEFGYLYRREEQNRSLTNTTLRHREVFLTKIKSLFPNIYGGHRPMACCGKGSKKPVVNTLQASSTTLEGGLARMAASVGSSGMTKLEYLGKQQSTIWDGPVTQVRYRFGVDRPVGWVDPRDVGEKGKSGFLNIKDRNNNYLFRVVDNSEVQAVGVEATPTEVPQKPETQVLGDQDVVSATVVEDGQEELTVVADPATQEDAVTATVVVEESGEAEPAFRYNPSEMYPSDIKRLNLTKEEWDTMYRLELAGKNRPTVTKYIEEQLANE